MRRAVFFDRDGTLIVDKHYMHKVEEIEYYPDTFSALKMIQEKGYLLFIVTNQSGIGRGIFTETDMHRVHNQMLKNFQDHDIEIQEIAFCPHAPEENCSCRKPKTEMVDQLCEKYNIERAPSHFIGDKFIDMQCGINAQMQGHILGHSPKPNSTFHSLTDFANFLP